MNGYSSFEPPPEGPLVDELRIRETFTRELHSMIAGLLIPVDALKHIAETVEQLDLENIDLESGTFPVIEGVAPVALLWKHACEDEKGNRTESRWYLVPLLAPGYTNEDKADLTTIMQLGGDFITMLVENTDRWQDYVKRWGSMP